MVDKFLIRVFGPTGRLLYKYFFVCLSSSSPLGPGTAGVLTVIFLTLVIFLFMEVIS